MLIASAVICGVVLVLLFVAVLKRRGADGGVPDTRRGGLWIPAVGGIAIPIVRTANELHIPVGVPVDVEVSSGDVVHSFWVPELNRKIDMIPSRSGDRPGAVPRAP